MNEVRMNRTSDSQMLCLDCSAGIHTNPPNGRHLCQCQEPICACIVAGGKPLPAYLGPS